jgi:glucose-1-phosphate cytidylyltransferase
MKVVILCGGLGTRLREETEHRPKAMVPIGGRPILWHIMTRYASYGFNEFVLCLGYKGDVIKNYFLHYRMETSDFTMQLGADGPERITYHGTCVERNWRITFVETGEQAMTGARVKRVEKYVDGDQFMLTYADGLADVDLAGLVKYHKQHGRVGTLTRVHPGPGRFGELKLEGDRVSQFTEKPEKQEAFINGGFFVFQRGFFDYLKDDDACVLEREPLQRLAEEGQLMSYRHNGYWACMDTYRDYTHLNELWARGEAVWHRMPPAAAEAPEPRRCARPSAAARV